MVTQTESIIGVEFLYAGRTVKVPLSRLVSQKSMDLSNDGTYGL